MISPVKSQTGFFALPVAVFRDRGYVIMKGTKALFSLLKASSFSAAGLALLAALTGHAQQASAQNFKGNDPTETRAFAPAANAEAQKMRMFKDADIGTEPTPGVIPRFGLSRDSSGWIATYQPGGPTFTQFNAFFQNLGTNQRTCNTCHKPEDGWTVSAASVASRFAQSRGKDPIFRLIDGATCPSDDVSTLAAKREAYKLLIEKGLIRIGLTLPEPEKLQFEVTSVVDPYHCTTNPKTGLTSKTTGTLSVYRRPLPSTNLGFLSTIMWDGREPDLEHQAVDATTGHAQAPLPGPTPEQVKQIVSFEKGLFTAQEYDRRARLLHAPKVTGGPVALSAVDFFIGINDPLGHNPTGKAFDPNVFDLYKYWQSLPGTDRVSEHRRSIARGEELFNTIKINITGVSGLNDDVKKESIAGECTVCHDTPNVGNHSVKAPLDIGIADAGSKAPPELDISGLPVFTLTCKQGPLAGNIYVVTDPGRALITGQCKDIGRVKGPILRGLAARAPYFHNGSAATLMDVVKFYEERFKIGLTNQQKQDLVNFLNTL
jgi:hypothetical protein